ncbi:MAG: TonB-dependent receptor [Desulfomonilia bacterium]|nr:TonB-dependent receptor [Desulfomonilia bacterium]
MRIICITFVLVSLILALPAFSSDQLEEVVVTATKTALSPEEAPAKVEVVTGEEIAKKNLFTVDQSFRMIPGIYSDRMSGIVGISDTFAPVFIRGMPSASQSLVLLDGQRMNNYEGTVQWWAIPVQNIDRVEVVKGPFSSLYGSGAMGGVVNIITRPDYSPLEASYGYGSYNSTLLSAGHGWSIGDLTYSITLRRFSIDTPGQTSTTGRPGTNTIEVPTADGGVTNIQGYTRTTASSDALTLGLSWDTTLDSSLDLKFTHATFELDPEETTTFDGARLSASYREHAMNNYVLSYRNAELDDIEILFNAGFTHNYKDLFIWNNASEDSTRPNSHYASSLQTNVTFDRHLLSVGADFNQGRVSAFDGGSSPEPDDDQTSKGTIRTIGLFIQDQFDITDKLSLFLGGRYDHWRTFNAATNSTAQGYPVEVSNNSEGHFSPKASLVYRPDSWTTARASAGEAFRGPTLWEAFKYSRGRRGTSLPNPELEPETIRSYELGIERILFTYFSLGFTYFNNSFDNMIYRIDVDDLDGDGNPDYLFENIGEASSRGYEATAGFMVRDDTKFFVNYTRTNTRIRSVDDPVVAARIEGKKFTDIPARMWNTGVTFDNGPVFGNLTIRYVGDRFANDDNSDTIDGLIDGYDPYSVIDLSLGFRIRNFEVTGAVYNVGDARYWETYDLSPGRTYFLKVTARL